MFLLAIIPFIFFVILFLIKKIKLIYITLASLLLTLFLVISVWQMNLDFVYISSLKGLFVAVDIFFIIFGAILFLETLKQTQTIYHLCLYLEDISKDYRVQVILLAWFLENFLEGTAGFGTPSAVVAPLLIGIGLTPILAVSTALLGNSTSGIFGAAGTPIRVGFTSLDISGVPMKAALINIIGFIVPVFMLWLITNSQKDQKNHFKEGLPFAIFSGLVFTLSSVLFVFLGQEFPSILGSILGLLIVIAAIKLNFLVPKNTRSIKEENFKKEKLPLFSVIFPYALLVILLILGKLLLGGKGFNLNFGLKHTFNYFNPGFAFILAVIPVSLIWIKNSKISFTIAGSALKRSIEPFLVIAFMSIMVQLMINSGQNINNVPSMISLIANKLENPMLPFFAPYIGAFGSFLTGSVTISNIMFGALLQNASLIVGISTSLILSLQLVGAAAGNMVALADILPALAVVGLKNQEREVIKRVIIPCLIYVTLVAIIGMALSPF